ncbi:MAG: metallophosphoesterase [Oscillospiraceae bacterium]|nr:metallophosphoesterase [Oscillospiraceae bacterium]
MSLFCIADLHLSLGTDKPMDIFAGWQDYTLRLLKNWNSIVKDNDTVVVAGDISWAMKLEECYNDFKFINDKLNGTKILLKGNHDYWWGTKKKIDTYLQDNNFDKIKILFNNSYQVGNYNICGTRGWNLEIDSDEDEKILNRELGRLKMSLDSADKDKETLVFLHYPPIYGTMFCQEIFDILNNYGIKKCYYGHLHGQKIIRYSYNGEYNGVNIKLISTDSVAFTPVLIG